jgi:DNA-binding NarL/FixJ family response regulator
MDKKIILADSQPLVSLALQSLLGVGCCIVAESAMHLNILLKNEKAKLLITDGAFWGDDYLFQLKRIKADREGLPVLFIAGALDAKELSELTKAKIQNIVLQTASVNEFILAVNSALNGKKYFDSDVLGLLMKANERNSNHKRATQLTASEKEIIHLISGGMTTKEIAERRNVSFHTVNTHRKNIYRKMEVNNASELIMKSIKDGIIDNIEYYI